MNIQIYVNKKNPDVLKAERFFKERRIPYQMMDLKKHKLGKKELEVFVKMGGAISETGRIVSDEKCPCGHVIAAGTSLSELEEV